MIKHIKINKIRIRFMLVLLAASAAAITLYFFCWFHRLSVWNAADTALNLSPQLHNEQFFQVLRKEALKYDIPKSENDREAISKLTPFFALVDDYTGIYIYGLEDGIYRAGKSPEFIQRSNSHVFFDIGYRITGGEGEQVSYFPLKFKNGSASLMLCFYHSSKFIYIYFIFLIILCVVVFLGIILFFINRKMKIVLSLKDEILIMSSGDLTHQIPDFGTDEIGILAAQLNQLRITLDENFQNEQKNKLANQDFITAISHDLRTPLTILKGYLEILKLKPNTDMQGKYIDCCLQKTADIQLMTDYMFEYALVSEENESPKLHDVPLSFFHQCLTENCEFLRLSGFCPNLHFPVNDNFCQGEEIMIKRIFNNIFSNILKYGDKQAEVITDTVFTDDTLKITITNFIKKEFSEVESTKIGLRSARKMIEHMAGKLISHEENDRFTVELIFPLTDKKV